VPGPTELINKRNPLAVAAAKLKRMAQPEFEDFLKQFDALVQEITVAVTDAPPTEIMGKQGAAKQMRSLQRMFHECDRERAVNQPPMPL
jgi:predicted Zn-dependent protease with MMP-like domain